ncbi:hypothetical protein DEO72_LG7g1038 [Vigna unguiculata]|uniref:Uncharacterized protein n=1 Tax=Vigna unguiculata TaxID=3917 RepID=A0A4D6MG31_VIGUN|nr:hypothetical protein DEO72_LG7g1038 [Vigna unguiculata]
MLNSVEITPTVDLSSHFPLDEDFSSQGEISSLGRVVPSLKATPSPRLDEEPLNHVISHRDLAQANVSRLSETESLKTPILLAWARYRAQKHSSFLATSLRRAVPRLSKTESLNIKPRSPGRAARPHIRLSNHTQKHTTKHAIDTNVIVMAISTQNHTFHTKLATTFEHTITNNLKGQNPSPATHYPHMIMHPNSNTPIPNHNTSECRLKRLFDEYRDGGASSPSNGSFITHDDIEVLPRRVTRSMTRGETSNQWRILTKNVGGAKVI